MPILSQDVFFKALFGFSGVAPFPIYENETMEGRNYLGIDRGPTGETEPVTTSVKPYRDLDVNRSTLAISYVGWQWLFGVTRLKRLIFHEFKEFDKTTINYNGGSKACTASG